MRWDNLRLDGEEEAAAGRAVPLIERSTVRTFDTPGFRGMTFHEVRARSIINRVPAASHLPFRWTINPYRGCSHACSYCFARNTHTYLDLDTGRDFDTQVVVKVNAGERVRRELAAPTWVGEHIAMGTNVDPYQRAEGRYGIMREILAALRDFANPFSILTKGSLILRDLDLLQSAAAVTGVGVNVSVGSLDSRVWKTFEPGTPGPRRRFEVCAELNRAGIGCGVMMAPILPYLTDSDERLEETVAAAAEAGAQHVTPIVLHLRPGAREWFLRGLRESHPELVPYYERLYRRGAYAPKQYRDRIAERVRTLVREHGIGGRRTNARRGAVRTRGTSPGSQQLCLY